MAKMKRTPERVRIYRAVGSKKNYADAYTIVFLYPKRIAEREQSRGSMYCCNVNPYGQAEGYWDDIPRWAVIGRNFHLGKKLKREEVPAEILEFADKRKPLWDRAVTEDNAKAWIAWSEF